jgi:tRNA(Ser,Leu) C12 N-acetylase TAN1
MKDWNVIVTTQENAFEKAISLLQKFGEVKKTEYFNVLVLNTENIRDFLKRFSQEVKEDPNILRSYVARVVPVLTTFKFQSPEEFENKAKELALYWVDSLAGKSFHVRMHRRGFKGRLVSVHEEQFLAQVLLEALKEKDQPSSITFEDPDAIISVETVSDRAGMSLWTREDLHNYPFLRLT